MSPKLTFVVATKDRPDELRRLWRSLLAQSRRPDEVLVVDAGARPAALDAGSAAGLKLRVLSTPVASASRQRNLGLDAAGDASLIGFLDDDAVLEADAVEEMLRFWRQAGADVAGAAFNMINHPPLDWPALKRTALASRLGLYSARGGGVTRSGFQTMIGPVTATSWTEWLPSGAAVWRREVFDRFRFDEWFEGYSYLEDLDFSYRVGRTARLAVVAPARYRHLPAAGGRGGGYVFGVREVLNRVHFVRKHSAFSLGGCRAALTLRCLMSLALAVRERRASFVARAFGNAVGLARSVLGAA
jgi:glycosyltransferase involved in cell wall biosynthesis